MPGAKDNPSEVLVLTVRLFSEVKGQKKGTTIVGYIRFRVYKEFRVCKERKRNWKQP